MRWRSSAALLLLLVPLVAGCGGGTPTVQGEVTLDGTALDDGLITFVPADAETRLAEVLERSTQYATTGGPFPDRLPIAAITGKLLMSQYEAVVQWARWAEEVTDQWSGVTPETGAAVPPFAFTSGWPTQDSEKTAKTHRRS